MTRSFRLLAFSLIAIVPSVSMAAEVPDGFQSLFNGQNLDGWYGLNPHNDANLAKQRAEFSSHWRVENGELVNDGHGPYATTDGEYQDYELRLEYRTVPIADSGVYLKGVPQVQIWDYTDPKKFGIGADLGSGGLWNNSPGKAGKDPLVLADRRLGEWNSFRIVQVGSRTTVWMNDFLVVDNAIMENYFDRGAPLPVAGPVMLQTHGGEIRWRNLCIRELSSDEANAVLADHQVQAFQSVFNGKDLAGWQGAVDNYEVIDGAIRCKAGHGGLLLTEGEYSNFIVRLEFRLPPGGNNGLAIRSPVGVNPAYGAMCELQVLDSEHKKYANLDARQYHGSAYGIAAARRGFLREAGQWNYQQVIVNGSQIQVELNGSVILDTDVSKVTEFMADSAHPGKDRTSGHFGFAGHNDPVEFRNVSIKRLAASE